MFQFHLDIGESQLDSLFQFHLDIGESQLDSKTVSAATLTAVGTTAHHIKMNYDSDPPVENNNTNTSQYFLDSLLFEDNYHCSASVSHTAAPTTSSVYRLVDNAYSEFENLDTSTTRSAANRSNNKNYHNNDKQVKNQGNGYSRFMVRV